MRQFKTSSSLLWLRLNRLQPAYACALSRLANCAIAALAESTRHQQTQLIIITMVDSTSDTTCCS